MAKYKYQGKFLSFKYKNWTNRIQGIIIDVNKDWTLLKSSPGDYKIDGYQVFRHKPDIDYYRGEWELFTEKVLKLKGVKVTEEEKIPITDLQAILAHISQHYGCFTIYLKSEKKCYLGKLKSLEKGKLVINYLDTKGKWSGTMSFRPGDVRVIEFDTDYINSLMLISQKKKQAKD